ncbi:MAG: hypothetical protein J0I00_01005 [Burkholderiales bacterium]|uniref:hypothetical protein n=1 Tax=Ottowia sp. TaxID=1898956 RepID=UPI001AD2D217|nr:hypothetical protein [Ottowia sp.]MBN9403977.1 hypothetical protein [Burkholderiales bacterium]MBS0403155.1 hypothetical protein [Pseudomonadota bacterium]MBS0413987.1 hypothetical protein [Pseudomonadota bacterium]
MAQQNTPQTIVGIEPDGPFVRLALRAGDTELIATLDPRRTALLAARLSYAIGEAILAAEQIGKALAGAQADTLLYHRRHDVENLAAPAIDAAAALELAGAVLSRAAAHDNRQTGAR